MAKCVHFFCKINNVLPVKISVSGEVWFCTWRKGCQIDFSSYSLPSSIIDAAKASLRYRLRSTGPGSIDAVKFLLRDLSICWQEFWVDFGSLTLLMVTEIWNSAVAESNREFRKELVRFYKYCENNSLCGAETAIYKRMRGWRCTSGRKNYRDLLAWHPRYGAMISGEFELVRLAVSSAASEESQNDHYIRILLWICIETLKRPGQVLEMTADALTTVFTSDGSSSYFLTIPKAKRQLGRPPEKWPITCDLAAELEKFCKRPGVHADQISCNRLLVCMHANPRRPNYNLSGFIKRWVEQRNIISSRTGDFIHLSPRRIRHSGATALALRGMPAPQIQYILEHDSPESCYVYIDAIGSELCPLVEKVDRKLGGIFSGLLEAYFLGRIGTKQGAPILIPVSETPAVVGGCNSNNGCSKHPFFSCYNGCRYFIAWRGADHKKALDYVQSELDVWRSAEGRYDRSKSIKDFERVYTAITQVIQEIKKGEGCE